MDPRKDSLRVECELAWAWGGLPADGEGGDGGRKRREGWGARRAEGRGGAGQGLVGSSRAGSQLDGTDACRGVRRTVYGARGRTRTLLLPAGHRTDPAEHDVGHARASLASRTRVARGTPGRK